jgi:hypothetical protein
MFRQSSFPIYILYKNGKYLFYHAHRWFGPYYAMHHTYLKRLIPLIFSHILKYYQVPNKTSAFYDQL